LGLISSFRDGGKALDDFGGSLRVFKFQLVQHGRIAVPGQVEAKADPPRLFGPAAHDLPVYAFVGHRRITAVAFNLCHEVADLGRCLDQRSGCFETEGFQNFFPDFRVS